MNKKLIAGIILSLFFPGVNAQLKQYEGEFPFEGIGFGGKGIAFYSYRDNPEGGRIFEGEFLLAGQRHKDHVIKGKFVNDRQEGEWVAVWNGYGLIVNFKNGVLNGECTLLKESPDYDEVMVFNMKDGKISGEYKYGYESNSRIRSEEGYVIDNIPVGVWRIRENNDSILYDFSNFPGELQITTVDNRTGDSKKEVRKVLPKSDALLPYEFSKGNWIGTYLDALVMRSSTPRVKGVITSENDVKGNDLNESVYTDVEQGAEFPGGEVALRKWISNNLRYTDEARKNNKQGRVIIRFVVEKDGAISNPEVTRGIDPDLDQEAVRLVKAMPKWQPGKNNGLPVRSYVNLPITFK